MTKRLLLSGFVLATILVAPACYASPLSPLSSSNLVASKATPPASAIDNPIRWALLQNYPSLLRDVSLPTDYANLARGQSSMLARRGLNGNGFENSLIVSDGTLSDWAGAQTAGWIVAAILALPLPFLFQLRHKRDPLVVAARKQAILQGYVDRAHR